MKIYKRIIAATGLCLLLAACNFFSKNEKNTPRDYDILDKDDIGEYVEDIDGLSDPVYIAGEPRIVRPDIVDGKGNIDIYKYASQDVQVEIEPMGYNTLTARISSQDPQANLRFGFLILPDNTMEEPFDRELTYQLPGDGIYKLIVTDYYAGEGEPWSGYFTLAFELE
ncbi:MAG: hypothetical protein LUD02_00350 [Tannerellaceae bacterium]|nr:hypothetical protein [Tannerellaceae bacterium]MCD8262783.1 hypothetical protein [Tannerellaceae bacterium]